MCENIQARVGGGQVRRRGEYTLRPWARGPGAPARRRRPPSATRSSPRPAPPPEASPPPTQPTTPVASLRASCPLPPPPGKELGFNGGRNLEAREKKEASRHLHDDGAWTILKPMTGGTSQFESWVERAFPKGRDYPGGRHLFICGYLVLSHGI